jgi:Uma2 family endonuclease
MPSPTLAGPTPLAFTDAELDRMVRLGVLPANHSRRGVRFTRDQYRTLAGHGFFDGRRVCLLHGEIIEMAAMKEPHWSGISLVVSAMRRAFPVGHNVRVQAPLDVNTANDPEPDVVVVPGDERTYRDSPTAPPATDALVVVEVAHTTLDQDITTKAELYATAGVPDYWVLDVENDRLLVFRDPQPVADAVAYQTCLTLTSADTVALLAVPGVPIPVADLIP